MEQVAPTDISVLILGETGTGKELVAEGIHNMSGCCNGPLVKVNCAAMPETMIESILFGHERGAFTGALQRHIGKFEQAHGGTLFLDEIAELPLGLQAKLLRALQEKEIERLGGNTSINIQCRIIAATNRTLEEEVAAGRFRMDLYYRLNVFPLTLPPLREREEDLAELVRHFSEYYSRKLGKPPIKVSAAALDQLSRYPWPGNIRELEHVVERAVLLASGDCISAFMLPDKFPGPASPNAPDVMSMEDNERRHIMHILKICKGKIAGKGGAAELLQMHPSTLNSRMRKLGIRKEF